MKSLLIILLLSGCSSELIRPHEPVSMALIVVTRKSSAPIYTTSVTNMTAEAALHWLNNMVPGNGGLRICSFILPTPVYVDDRATLIVGHEVDNHCLQGHRHP